MALRSAALVTQTEDSHTKQKGTPFTRIQYNDLEKRWKQEEFGMLVFLDRMPNSGSRQFVITEVVNSQRACHATIT